MIQMIHLPLGHLTVTSGVRKCLLLLLLVISGLLIGDAFGRLATDVSDDAFFEESSSSFSSFLWFSSTLFARKVALGTCSFDVNDFVFCLNCSARDTFGDLLTSTFSHVNYT